MKETLKNINNVKNEIRTLRNQINDFGLFNRNLKFTTREITILLAVSKGMSNKEIA